MTSTIALADCDYVISAPVLSYGVDDNNTTIEGNVGLLRRKNSSVCSNFFLAFTKGWAGNYNRKATNILNGDVIFYNLYKNSNLTGVLKEPSDIATNNEVLFGSIAKDETKTLNYYFSISPININTPPKSGVFIDVVQVQAYSGTYQNINSYEGYRDLNVYIHVPKFISLAIVNSGEIFDPARTSKTLDFGELEEREELTFDVRIVSNAGYSLKVSSINNGLLKRVNGSGANSEIIYDLYASGSKKIITSSASNPVTIANANGRTPSGGAQIPMKVVIKSVTDKDPGTYQDYITLSVISND